MSRIEKQEPRTVKAKTDAEPVRTEEVKTERPVRPTRANKRKPIGRGNVLRADKRPGFVRRFVNEKPGRIQEFLDAGYEIVTDGSSPDDGRLGSARRMGSATGKHVGEGLNAILMEIPEELYMEDQAAKQRENDRQAATNINSDGNGGKITDHEEFYGEGVKASGRPTIEV